MGVYISIGAAAVAIMVAVDAVLARRFRLSLVWRIVIGFAVGALAGLAAQALLGPSGVIGSESSEAQAGFIAALTWAKGVFLSLLKSIVMPLVVVCMIAGVSAAGSAGRLGRLGAYSVGYYLSTTAISVLIGLALVSLIRPGDGFPLPESIAVPDAIAGAKGLAEIFASMIPSNFFGALSSGDTLPVIFFSILAGVAMVLTGERAAPVAKFFESAYHVVMRLAEIVLETVPVGVAVLMALMLAEGGLAVLASLPKYIGAVIGGLAIHAVVLSLILAFVARRRVAEYLAAVSPALATAFSTSSSGATLPLTVECVRDNAKVSPRAVNFVLPLGATINMDGTALYEAVAVVFIAQAYGIELSLGGLIVVFITATIAAIGAAAIPSAGLFTMVIVLSAAGIPVEGIGLILGVDRFLDMCRTTVNVYGDTVGAAVVARLVPEDAAA